MNSVTTQTRRQFLQAACGSYSLSWGGLLSVQAAAAQRLERASASKKIRSCILIFYYGGPSQLDTYDLKPRAPAEVRGEFRPVATSVPGVQICEHLPRMAKLMHKAALVRSVHHAARLHDSASIHALTGRPLDGSDRELFTPLPQFYPSLGSVVARLDRNHSHDVPFASLPCTFHNVVDVPCQGAGFLGQSYDPLLIEADLATQRYRVDQLRAIPDLSSTRHLQRHKLLGRIEQQVAGGNHSGHRLQTLYDRAFALLGSAAIRKAMDISEEPSSVRERYGFDVTPVAIGEGGGGGNGAEMGAIRQMRGQNLLLARRLVEAGVPFVNVFDFKQQGQNWDAHFKCANQHKRFLLPLADQSLSALIEDLDARGLLDSTLVVALGEFGRTPRINKDGGRDHWPDCYTVLLAGGGVAGGAVHGASDRIGAFPAQDPVTPGDLAATIFWRFGMEPDTEIHDQSGRPHRIASGDPLRKLFDA